MFLHPEILAEKLNELHLPEIDEMSAVSCYEQLTADRNTAEPLSPMVKFKRIMNSILGFYDLIVDDECRKLLQNDDTVNLVYRHSSPIFRNQYVFDMTIALKSEGYFGASLNRRRILTPELRKQWRSIPMAAFVEIESELIPSLIEGNVEIDLCNIMTIIQIVVQRFNKIWKLSSSIQATPNFDLADLEALDDIMGSSTSGP